MATTFNKVTGIFRLGSDPEIRYSAAGLAIANISGASDNSFKKNDEWQKETEWTRMVAFSKTAERIGEQLKKGSLVYVEGRLKTNKWDDKDGVTRYSTDVVISSINFLDGYTKREWDGGQSGGGGYADSRQAPQNNQQQQNRQAPIDDSDIPF